MFEPIHCTTEEAGLVTFGYVASLIALILLGAKTLSMAYPSHSKENAEKSPKLEKSLKVWTWIATLLLVAYGGGVFWPNYWKACNQKAKDDRSQAIQLANETIGKSFDRVFGLRKLHGPESYDQSKTEIKDSLERYQKELLPTIISSTNTIAEVAERLPPDAVLGLIMSEEKQTGLANRHLQEAEHLSQGRFPPTLLQIEPLIQQSDPKAPVPLYFEDAASIQVLAASIRGSADAVKLDARLRRLGLGSYADLFTEIAVEAPNVCRGEVKLNSLLPTLHNELSHLIEIDGKGYGSAFVDTQALRDGINELLQFSGTPVAELWEKACFTEPTEQSQAMGLLHQIESFIENQLNRPLRDMLPDLVSADASSFRKRLALREFVPDNPRNTEVTGSSYFRGFNDLLLFHSDTLSDSDSKTAYQEQIKKKWLAEIGENQEQLFDLMGKQMHFRETIRKIVITLAAEPTRKSLASAKDARYAASQIDRLTKELDRILREPIGPDLRTRVINPSTLPERIFDEAEEIVMAKLMREIPSMLRFKFLDQPTTVEGRIRDAFAEYRTENIKNQSLLSPGGHATKLLNEKALPIVQDAIRSIKNSAELISPEGTRGRYEQWDYWTRVPVVTAIFQKANEEATKALGNAADADEAAKKTASEDHYKEFPDLASYAAETPLSGNYTRLGAYFTLLYQGPNEGPGDVINPFQNFKLTQQEFSQSVDAEMLKRLSNDNLEEMVSVIKRLEQANIEVEERGLEPYFLKALQRLQTPENGGRATK